MNYTFKHNGRDYANVTAEYLAGLVANGTLNQAEADTIKLQSVTTRLKQDIDLTAGQVRVAFVSKGQLVEEEYHLAKTEADAWDGTGQAPANIAAWAAASGMTEVEARDDILTTANQWEQALTAIRAARLQGKAAVAAATTEQDAVDAADAAISQLKALMPA